MKRIICLVIALLIMACASSVALAKGTKYYDDEHGFAITLPDGAIALNRSNLSRNSDFIERLGFSVKSFRSKLEESNILLYAADSDNTYQIQVRVWESTFSREIKNLSGLKGDRLNEALSLLGGNISASDSKLIDSRVIWVNEQPYLNYTVKVEEAFCYVESLTVVDGKCVALVYYNSNPTFSTEDSAAQQKLISSLKIDRKNNGSWGSGYNLLLRVVCALLVIGASVVVVFLISGFIKDIKNRREQPEIIPDRIKMRRK